MMASDRPTSAKDRKAHMEAVAARLKAEEAARQQEHRAELNPSAVAVEAARDTAGPSEADIDAGGQSLSLSFSGVVEGDSLTGAFGSDFGDFDVTGTRQ